MILITEIISKPVLCLSCIAAAGTVENAVFDKKLSKIAYLCVFNEKSGETKYLASKNILNAQNNAVTVKSTVFEGYVTPNSPLKAPLYDCEGTLLGIIEDIALDNELKTLYVTCGGKQIKQEEIISFSPEFAVFAENGIKPRYIKRSRSSCCKDNSKKQQLTDEQTENIDKEYDNNNDVPIQLNNIVPPYNYLIGRKATEDIFDKNKNLIIKKNGIITLKTIDTCRKNNRLMTIAKNSKKI